MQRHPQTFPPAPGRPSSLGATDSYGHAQHQPGSLVTPFQASSSPPQTPKLPVCCGLGRPVSQWLFRHAAPCCPLSCALGRHDIPMSVPLPAPGTSEVHWRQALRTLADPSPNHGPTAPLASPNHFARRHTRSLRDANPKAPNSRHTDFARRLRRAGLEAEETSEGGACECRLPQLSPRGLLGVVVSRT